MPRRLQAIAPGSVSAGPHSSSHRSASFDAGHDDPDNQRFFPRRVQGSAVRRGAVPPSARAVPPPRPAPSPGSGVSRVSTRPCFRQAMVDWPRRRRGARSPVPRLAARGRQQGRIDRADSSRLTAGSHLIRKTGMFNRSLPATRRAHHTSLGTRPGLPDSFGLSIAIRPSFQNARGTQERLMPGGPRPQPHPPVFLRVRAEKQVLEHEYHAFPGIGAPPREGGGRPP